MPVNAGPALPIRSRPELLAPAGDATCLRAAIENGADAVYFGLDHGFNARARATNFHLDGVAETMATLHGRGVRGYVTMNTLAFTDELPEVERIARRLVEAGVDALLVQDLGVARLLKTLCPELELHASTQMTLTCAEAIRVAETLGIARVVLARELSLEEIREIGAGTTMPLEVFVHGALCVAYSGQCLTSESLGGRSANRGQCAQACRLPYELICDGKDVDLGDQKYLLSPQDLAAYDLIPELIDAGVCSFKIEGRLKTPEYVANITKHYRRAIDEAIAGRAAQFSAVDVEEMELSFSRGFSHGWLDGNDHKKLVPAFSSAKRGVLLGEIHDIYRQSVAVRLRGAIRRGDGVVFAADRAEGAEQGGRVYEVLRGGESLTDAVNDGLVELTFARGAIDFDRLAIGQPVWKTDDPQLTSRLRKSFEGAPQRRMPIDLDIRASVGSVLTVIARTEQGVSIELASPDPLEEARKHPLTQETLAEQFGRLGGTAYQLRNVVAHIDGQPMLPLSVLGKLRHELVARLDVATALAPRRTLRAEPALEQLRSADAKQSSPAETSEPALRVLCRSLPQLEAVLEAGVRRIYADFADIREYKQAVTLARLAGAEVFLATPRIQKPGETGIFLSLAKQEAHGILVRNLGGIAFFMEREVPIVADFSFNATNELTVAWLLQQGARRVTASYDMNREQLLGLVQSAPASVLEAVIHQHMPMFHMEHCVFCAVMSPGTNKHNCGRPCDVHVVKLRDRVGMEHPLTADVGCRNTLFNAAPQSAAEVVPELLKQGVRHFRIELLADLPADDLRRVMRLYQDLLAGRVTGREVWSQLRAANRVGVTRGTLEERRNPLAIL
jgi:putative protease